MKLFTWCFVFFLLPLGAQASCSDSDWDYAIETQISRVNAAVRSLIELVEDVCHWDSKQASSDELCGDFSSRQSSFEQLKEAREYLVRRYKKRENVWYSLYEDCKGKDSELAYGNYRTAVEKRKESLSRFEDALNQCQGNIQKNIDQFCR